MNPQWSFRLGAKELGATHACAGVQIALVVGAISEVRADLQWFAAEVRPPGRTNLPSSSSQVFVGTASALIGIVADVTQIESGAFAGLPRDETPRFREGGLFSDDKLESDLGTALVEVRAFDTTHLEVPGRDEAMREAIVRALPPQAPAPA